MIKSFFRERDCVTLIRPLVEEEKLRNLNEIEFEEMK